MDNSIVDKLKILQKDISIFYKDDNNKPLYKFKNNSPLYDISFKCHENGLYLPNDFIFESIKDIIENTIQYNPENLDDFFENDYNEMIDGLVCIYNHDLLDWYKTFYDYVEQAQNNGLISEKTDEIKRLMIGQYFHLDFMAQIVLSEINNMEV